MKCSTYKNMGFGPIPARQEQRNIYGTKSAKPLATEQKIGGICKYVVWKTAEWACAIEETGYHAQFFSYKFHTNHWYGRKIGGICKHVKTNKDRIPCLSFSAQIPHKSPDKGGQFHLKSASFSRNDEQFITVRPTLTAYYVGVECIASVWRFHLECDRIEGETESADLRKQVSQGGTFPSQACSLQIGK